MQKYKVAAATRRKISKTMTGHAVSPETRKKISEAMTGIKRSEETRARMSASQQRIVKEGKRKQHMILAGGISKSLSEWARLLGIDKSLIVCARKRKIGEETYLNKKIEKRITQLLEKSVLEDNKENRDRMRDFFLSKEK